MGEEKKITLPRDVEGREIPLDTKVMYYGDGSEHKVLSFTLSVIDNIWRVLFADDPILYNTNNVYLNSPDSWEKLLEDLDNASKGGDNAECLYMRRDGMEVQCPGCRLEDDEGDLECSYLAYGDIAARIRRLRGEGDGGRG